jgi:hypothetical protein
MSDTEEVVIPRANRSQLKVNTKPEIAREKLKEKRERLKREKDEKLIEEAKKRLLSESEKKQQEELIAKQQEEEKKKNDPTYALMLRMEQMMAMLNQPKEQSKEQLPSAPKQRASKKKVIIPEPEPDSEPEVIEKPKRKPRVPKEPKPIQNVPKRKKKVVYLQQDPVPEQSTQFVGYDIAPPQEPIQYQPSSGLLSAMMGRRNMNSFQY